MFKELLSEDIEKGIRGENNGVPTGFPILDSNINGIQKSLYTIVGGNSGTGWTGGSTSTTETQAWVDNVTHQSAVSMTVDATAETVVVLTFDLKQTYF